MIYRIEVIHQGIWDFSQVGPGTIIPIGRWMDLMGLPHPLQDTFRKPGNVEFWFTEKGWKTYGEPLLEKIGEIAKTKPKIQKAIVLTAERPRSYKVRYCDEYQLALDAYRPSIDFLAEQDKKRMTASVPTAPQMYANAV